MIIDIHPHIISDDEKRYPVCPLGNKRSEWSEKRGTLTAEQLLSEMEKAGVGYAVVVHSSTTYGHDNSYVADSSAKYPEKLSAVGSVDLMDDHILEQLRYWVKTRNLIGIRLFTRGSTMAQTDWLDNPKTYPAWEWLEEQNIPVCVQISSSGLYMLENIMKKYPGIRFILDHATAPELDDGYPYAGLKKVLELAVYPQLYIKVTTVNLQKAAQGKSTPQMFMRTLVKAYGAERIAWGSNFPASEGSLREHVKLVRDAVRDLTVQEQEAVLFRTAQRFYGFWKKQEISAAAGDYPWTLPFKEGRTGNGTVQIRNISYSPVHKAFAPMVRSLAFDVCEMAAVTFLQAVDAGKPLKLLPVVTVSKFHHHSLWYDTKYGVRTPEMLSGGKVGVRAYSQTTGMWVRGILKEQFQVDPQEITWVTTEGAHVAEYKNPENVVCVEGGNLESMLTEGKIDAVIMGPEAGKPGMKCVIPDADAAAAAWYEKHHAVPVNHMIAVTDEMVREHPETVKEVYRMFCESFALSGMEETERKRRTDPDECWEVLSLAMRYSVEQKLISRMFRREEVFPDFFSNQ